MHNFNFLVELVLKKCIYPCNYSHKKDFVYFGYLQKCSHDASQSILTTKSQGQAMSDLLCITIDNFFLF